MSIDQKTLDKYRSFATTSSKAALTESLIAIIGAPGVGKTSLLLSASKFFKGFPNPDYNKETGQGLIKLTDLGIVQIDPGATDGYLSVGYDVDIIPYRKILRDVEDPERAAEISLTLAAEWKDKDYYGLDSVSQFDDDEFNYLQQNEGLYMSEKTGKTDNRKMWDLLRSAHGTVYNSLSRLPGIKIFIGHVKAITDDLVKKGDEKQAFDRKEKTTLAGNASITLDVTGKSERNWIRLNSLQIGVRVVEDPRTRKLSRVLETEYNSTVDMAVKNRFSNLIGPNPEFNLRKIIDAIRGQQVNTSSFSQTPVTPSQVK